MIYYRHRWAYFLLLFTFICILSCIDSGNRHEQELGKQQQSLHYNSRSTLHRYSSNNQQSPSAPSFPPLYTETESDPQFVTKNQAVGMDIVYINLDKSWQRRHYLQETLHFYGFRNSQINRIAAFQPEDVIVPSSLMDVMLCNRVSKTEFRDSVFQYLHTNNTDNGNYSTSTDSDNGQRKVFLEALCGRKKNSHRELTVTLSHLLALHHILYATNKSVNINNNNPYALVLEDDLHLLMEVDFMTLINTAPMDFGILQLVTSNDYSVSNLWKVYLRHKLLWVKKKEKDDYWCAGAYIVHKQRLKPFLFKIFSQLHLDTSNTDNNPTDTNKKVNGHYKNNNMVLYRANIVAAYSAPCMPKNCCPIPNSNKLVAVSDNIDYSSVDKIITTINNENNISNSNGNIKNTGRRLNAKRFFSQQASTATFHGNIHNDVDNSNKTVVDDSIESACVRSSRGFQSDAFLFSLTPGHVYMLTIPLFTNSATGNISTVHQRHVAWHQASFRRVRKIHALLLSGKVGVKMPDFFNGQCRIGPGLILSRQYRHNDTSATMITNTSVNPVDNSNVNSYISESNSINHNATNSNDHDTSVMDAEHWRYYWQEKQEQEEWIVGVVQRKFNIIDA